MAKGIGPKLADFVVRHPSKAFWCTCCGNCCFFFLFILLVISFGSSFFPFSSEVPLYLRDSVSGQRADALVQGKKVADFSPEAFGTELERTVIVDEDQQDLVLEFVFESKYGNILEYSNLQKIRELEQRVMRTPGFSDFCQLDWTEEQRTSAMEAYNNGDEATLAAIKAAVPGCKSPLTAFRSCDPTQNPAGVEGCEHPTSFPVGLLDCHKTDSDCTVSEGVLSAPFVKNKIDQLSVANWTGSFEEGTVGEFYLGIIDKNFGQGVKTSKALQTKFFFGLPLPGFKSSTHNKDEQYEKIKEFIYDNYFDWAMDLSYSDFNVWMNGYGVLEIFLGAQMITDMTFALGAFIFVFIYMAVMMSSWFLAMCGMFQIFISMFPTYIIYYAVFNQRYFGVFNLLSIFLILGIGADSIFYLVDKWNQSKMQSPVISVSRRTRFIWTWHHTATACFVTSFSTLVSFLSNANSSFPAISTFGIFASVLVAYNYLCVITFFPTAVMYFHVHFEDKPFCFGAFSALGRWLSSLDEDKTSKKSVQSTSNLPSKKQGVKITQTDVVNPKTTPPGSAGFEDKDYRQSAASSASELEQESSSFIEKSREELAIEEEANFTGLVKWFNDSYSQWLIQKKYFVLLAFLGVLIVFFTYAAQIEPSKEFPQFLPPNHMLQAYFDKVSDYYGRGGNYFAVTVTLTWGFNAKNPIDRSGTTYTKPEDKGRPVWDENFNIAKAADCIATICQNAQAQDPVRATAGGSYKITCFPLALKEYVIQYNGSSVWQAITGPAANETLFVDFVTKFLADTDNFKLFFPYLHAEEFENGTLVLRYMDTELKLLVETFSIKFQEGIDLFWVWEDWFQQQYQMDVCKDVAQYAPGFVGGDWDWFFVNSELVSEAFSGIALSISLAFLVLTVATHNILGALYATAMITCIVVCVLGFMVMKGWPLGVLQSICLVMVPGLSVDFTAHAINAYLGSVFSFRLERVRDMLAHTGISIMSGAFSTIGASSFMLFPLIVFFNQFGTFILVTISLSIVFTLLAFAALLSTPISPSGQTGDLLHYGRIILARFGKGPYAESGKDTDRPGTGDKDIEMENKAISHTNLGVKISPKSPSSSPHSPKFSPETQSPKLDTAIETRMNPSSGNNNMEEDLL